MSTTIQNLKDLLENVVLVDAKPYYLIHQNEWRYLRECGVSENGLNQFMELVIELKHFHMSVHRFSGNKDWEQYLTKKDIETYLSFKDSFLQSRRDHVTSIMLQIQQYLSTTNTNNLPITDMGHALYMKGMARWYLGKTGDSGTREKMIKDGDVLNFFSVTGHPSPVVVTSQAREKTIKIPECTQHTVVFKTAQEEAAKNIRTPMTASNMNFEKIPKINVVAQHCLKRAILFRHKFISLCLSPEGHIHHHTKPILLRDMHRVASLILTSQCQGMTEQKPPKAPPKQAHVDPKPEEVPKPQPQPQPQKDRVAVQVQRDRDKKRLADQKRQRERDENEELEKAILKNTYVKVPVQSTAAASAPKKTRIIRTNRRTDLHSRLAQAYTEHQEAQIKQQEQAHMQAQINYDLAVSNYRKYLEDLVKRDKEQRTTRG